MHRVCRIGMNAVSHRWTVLPNQPSAESLLANGLKISPLLARILVQRGHDTPEKAELFLNPRLKNLGDPFALGSLREAAARVWQAIERGERIVIYGDYDVDGVTSTAMLFRVLRAFGGTVSHFLPRRMDEGYGLSADGIERCIEETKPQLLIAVDCGTTASKEIAELKRRGVEVIVLDHHSAGGELPSCLLINPKVETRTAELEARNGAYHLATVGLVFKLCHGFLKLGRELGKPVQEFDLRQYLDLVAVGTVADVVPLEGENRILVKAGLDQLARTTNVGLRTLKDIAGIPERLNPHHIGFQIGPRLNAMGRLSDALVSLELLLTEDPARAQELAATLDQCNRERQEIEQRTFEQALARLDGVNPLPLSIVLAQEGWHIGVIGIVAARVMRQFHRPTAIIGLDSNGAGKGSCRSVEGFPIVDALRRCEKLLTRFGGHQAAAGFSIEAKNVEAFRVQLETVAREMLNGETLLPTIRACADVPLHSITPELMNELAMLEPFGTSNPQPVFVAHAVPLRSAPRTVGTGHLKLWLGDRGQSFDAIKFGVGDWQPKSDRVDIAFTPHWNEYQGKRTIQLKMMDVRETGNAERES
jgi:single-stranded-DNA-specific exonuclease